MEEKSVFLTLNEINVNDKTEMKGKLTYLSWAWAWGEVKKKYPDAAYTVYENKDGWNYFTDGRTCWVKTGVTIKGQEHIEYLPVMDNLNRSISADKVTSFDVNKTIQRSITKACARHGLGLYIYAGEDLPDGEEPLEKPQNAPKPSNKPTEPKKAEKTANAPKTYDHDEIGHLNNNTTFYKHRKGDIIVDKKADNEPIDELPFPMTDTKSHSQQIAEILVKQEYIDRLKKKTIETYGTDDFDSLNDYQFKMIKSM